MESTITTALQRLGINELTPIQEKVIEQWLDNDMIGLAHTGSGKTLAFVLSSLRYLDSALYQPQILILCPTRELAQQVASVCQQASQTIDNVHTVTLIGGDPMGAQIKTLKGACHIVVGTPGRVLDHVQKRRLNLEMVHTRILDEADRMLEMGMREDVDSIFAATPQQARTGLFSATYPNAVTKLAQQWLSKPVQIDVREDIDRPVIEQQVFKAEGKQKLNALNAILTDKRPEKCIVFCRTKQGTENLFTALKNNGFSAVQMHGDMTQEQRQRSLIKLSIDAATVLVATDVAARGLDLPNVDLVVSYDLSESIDTHTHRIGRTGRAGAKGLAVSLATDAEVERAKHFSDGEQPAKVQGVQHLRFHANRINEPAYVALLVKGGKKDKLRKGDILGALTKEADIPGEDIGTMVLTAKATYLGIKQRSVKKALRHFKEGKIKGRRYQAGKF